MVENKTKPHDGVVGEYLQTVENERRRTDCKTVIDMMTEITGEPAIMWGPSMIGFGSYHYKYDSGHEGDYFVTGLAPRKGALTIYIMPGYQNYAPILDRLGKHRKGKSCLYLNKLDDVDLDVLRELITAGVIDLKKLYPSTS